MNDGPPALRVRAGMMSEADAHEFLREAVPSGSVVHVLVRNIS